MNHPPQWHRQRAKYYDNPDRRPGSVSLTPCDWKKKFQKTVLASFPSPKANAHIIDNLGSFEDGQSGS